MISTHAFAKVVHQKADITSMMPSETVLKTSIVPDFCLFSTYQILEPVSLYRIYHFVRATA
jgi:hypothetical protein